MNSLIRIFRMGFAIKLFNFVSLSITKGDEADMEVFQAAQKEYENERLNCDISKRKGFNLGKIFEVSYQP